MHTTTLTPVQQFARYGYVPFMLLGLNGVAVALAAAGAPKYWLLLVLAVAVVASFLVERVIPYEAAWNHDQGDSVRDRIHAAVNETLILVSVAAIPLLAAIVPAPGIWPRSWPFLLQVIVAILVADLGITIVHLASHKIGALWRFHAVHHSVTRFYGLNGLMKHPLHQTIEMAAGVAPLILIGLPVDVASALALAVAIQLLLQHSNADYRVGPAKYLLALNEGHRFHHLKWAGIGDVNFGLFTLIWDHLLRTFSYDPNRRFASEHLGMAAKPNFPKGYVDQLVYPFMASGGCDTAPPARARLESEAVAGSAD
ncbi:sterol desaturase family protein [Rhodococcus ruber]|nr:sterol desaturase family protein [Rhodococcus ruber]MCD2127228.1 sterol desaturase family protein [Rhodococcus ruber]MCZ4503175.1 sterol desaturase family protein [Rhodococcus ruber]MCZ4530730.1 sterol desaturase family protein [Rhodococcus ruber]MCZ4621570.1 sterol desaturase family protein [Rhodococcus ruber]MDI9969454.1 sterol desaturase family protein [Rhodococcus ruber]